jgi:hypothetical protein
MTRISRTLRARITPMNEGSSLLKELFVRSALLSVISVSCVAVGLASDPDGLDW